MVTTIQKSVYYLRYSELEIFDIIQFVIKLLIKLYEIFYIIQFVIKLLIKLYDYMSIIIL